MEDKQDNIPPTSMEDKQDNIYTKKYKYCKEQHKIRLLSVFYCLLVFLTSFVPYINTVTACRYKYILN